jgi:flagellar hook-associated protein 2
VGTDVAGSFIVDGQTEAATGRGRLLSGDSDNANTADLQVRVLYSSSQVVAGAEAEITVTAGLGSSLDRLIGDLLDTENGAFTTADKAFTQQAESIQKTIDRQSATFSRQQTELLKQFAALESALSTLKSTSSFVASQLAGTTT